MKNEIDEPNFYALGDSSRSVLACYAGMLSSYVEAFRDSVTATAGVEALRHARVVLKNAGLALDAAEAILDEKHDYSLQVSEHVHKRALSDHDGAVELLGDLGIRTVTQAMKDLS